MDTSWLADALAAQTRAQGPTMRVRTCVERKFDARSGELLVEYVGRETDGAGRVLHEGSLVRRVDSAELQQHADAAGGIGVHHSIGV